jgi:predicted naringenin-chalcone synthase
MFLHSIAPAWPDIVVTQAEALHRLRESPVWQQLRARSRDLLEKVLSGDSGIVQRRVWTADAPLLLGAGPGELAALFEKAAPALAARALRAALENGGIAPASLDALFICTCTGYLCPGVTSHVAEALGLRSDAVLHDLVGLGCGAAIPALRAASHFLTANPGATAAVVAVEICSAAFYLNDDPGVLISLCLFGDGACATLWKGQCEAAATPWRAHSFRSLHIPEEREKIRFVNAGGRLRNQLHRSVPAIAASAVEKLYAADAGAGMPANVRVISHAGGRDVVEALRAVLPGQALAETEQILRECGNVSSVSVLAALDRALVQSVREPLWLTSFGAGFSAHSCRLERT